MEKEKSAFVSPFNPPSTNLTTTFLRQVAQARSKKFDSKKTDESVSPMKQTIGELHADTELPDMSIYEQIKDPELESSEQTKPGRPTPPSLTALKQKSAAIIKSRPPVIGPGLNNAGCAKLSNRQYQLQNRRQLPVRSSDPPRMSRSSDRLGSHHIFEALKRSSNSSIMQPVEEDIVDLTDSSLADSDGEETAENESLPALSRLDVRKMTPKARTKAHAHSKGRSHISSSVHDLDALSNVSTVGGDPGGGKSATQTQQVSDTQERADKVEGTVESERGNDVQAVLARLKERKQAQEELRRNVLNETG